MNIVISSESNEYQKLSVALVKNIVMLLMIN